MNARSNLRGVRWGFLAGFPLVLLAGLSMTGCPTTEYDLGFEVGFAEDDWYDEGYYDSQDTLGYGPILYEGDEIPAPTSPEYDRGYWDGVWTAYNDGYFVSYDDAFTEGFMDGYEAAYADDWETFLLSDEHIEYGTGGYDDGYNDGFSEGRLFGAQDWIDYYDSDWELALEDYRAPVGKDLCVDVAGPDICTEGFGGPVILYLWGETPPYAKKSAEVVTKRVERSDAPSIRRASGEAGEISKRRQN